MRCAGRTLLGFAQQLRCRPEALDRDLEVFRIDQDVLGHEISMHEVQPMDVGNGLRDGQRERQELLRLHRPSGVATKGRPEAGPRRWRSSSMLMAGSVAGRSSSTDACRPVYG